MLVWRAATVVLALVVVSDATPTGTWTFGRHSDGRAFGAGRFSPFSHFPATSYRSGRASTGYEATPVGDGGFSQGRAVDTTIEAIAAPALSKRAAPGEILMADPAVSSATELTASMEPLSPLVFTADASPVEETKASAMSQESPSASAPASAAIFFPDQVAPLAPKSGDVFVPECDGVPFMALNSETGRCQFLMMRTECPEGQWFILDRDTLQASCQPLPCPDAEVLFNGECRPREDASLCPDGMVVLVNEYGDASCDCAVKNLYWPDHDRCYPAFRQGPCHVGQYLTVGEEGVQCSENVCVRDGAVLWKATKRCHRLQDETDSPCDLGRLDVGEDTLELECDEVMPFAIFDFPVVRCSKGSKLDYRGRCKRELYQKFRSSFNSGPARKKDCGKGFIQGASGRCLKAAE